MTTTTSNKRKKTYDTTTEKKRKIGTLLDYVERNGDENQRNQVVSDTHLVQVALDRRQWYRIAKPLPNEDWKVMAIPKVSKLRVNDDVVEPYPLYEETDQWVCVPRFFGIEKYGPVPLARNHLTEGEPMNFDLEFGLKLQNTPQRPQLDAANAWLNNNGGEGILCLYCGAGKTVIAIYLALQKRRRTLILVHNEGLMHQWVERINMICPNAKVGIIRQKKHEVEGMDFVIGMIQTVRGINDEDIFNTIGLVIVDECHHIAAKTFSQAVLKTKARYIMGLSATPERKDGLTYVLHWLLGPMVFHIGRQDKIPQQITQIIYDKGNQKVIKYKNGMVGVPTMITRMTRDTKRNQLIDFCLKRLNSLGCKILLVSDRREHLEEMFEKYSEKVYDVGLYIGRLKKSQLEEAKKRQIILASYSMAQEFLDIPGLNGLILSTPCMSNIEQVVGRLRENLASGYDKRCTVDEDDEREEELEFLFQSVGLSHKTINIILGYAQQKLSRERIVYDIVDPFDLFDGMSWKRYKTYKDLRYEVRRVSTEEFLGQFNSFID